VASDPTTADEAVPAKTFRAQPATRQRVADHVFESLVKAILNSELKPGDPVPTQRDLARQFGVSALVVRQAIHRLEDLGLVRVRQGSTTIVLDPNEASDIRLIQLQMELAEPGPAQQAAAFENQALFMMPLLVLAERRITDKELGVLNYLIDQLGEQPTVEAGRRFRIEFWRQIASATRNPLFQQQVRWWSTMVAELDRRGTIQRIPARLDVGYYKRLIAALTVHSGVVPIYLEWVRPLLDWVDAKQGYGPRKPTTPG
jgi:GntR family transcriptional repressor for pyruvate dehydrogenase complex